MEIASWSDGHGCLPQIKKHTDLLIIAGDIIPLDIQCDIIESTLWFEKEFMKYIKECDCDRVLLVPGNHDFFLQDLTKQNLNNIIKKAELQDKFTILIDQSVEYNGYKIYGTPWIEGLKNWAFYAKNTKTKYKKIPSDCDILITHMPPKIEKVGCSYPNLWKERNFGSQALADIIAERNIKLHFCGHVHSGTHCGVKSGDTTIYNVSLLDEDYNFWKKYDITEVNL